MTEIEITDFEQLHLLFRRSRSLPQLPGRALELINLIDKGDASAGDLEKLIASDPALAAGLLRMPSNPLEAGGHVPMNNTIKSVIMRMGQRTVRSIAVSLIVQGFVSSENTSSEFDPYRFARHSLLVGHLARYLYARKKKLEGFKTGWAADEVFAAGVIHDLGVAMLAKVAPNNYDTLASASRADGTCLETSFSGQYQHSLAEIGSSVAEAWGLPPMFVTAIKHLASPWDFADETTCLSCLCYADYLANLHGISIEAWPVMPEMSPLVEMEISIPEEEAKQVVLALLQLIEGSLPAPKKKRAA